MIDSSVFNQYGGTRGRRKPGGQGGIAGPGNPVRPPINGPGGTNPYSQGLQSMPSPGINGPGGINPYAGGPEAPSFSQGTQGWTRPGINGPGGTNPALNDPLASPFSQGTQGWTNPGRNGPGGINPALNDPLANPFSQGIRGGGTQQINGPGGINPYIGGPEAPSFPQGMQGWRPPPINGPGGTNPAFNDPLANPFAQGTQGWASPPRNGLGGMNSQQPMGGVGLDGGRNFGQGGTQTQPQGAVTPVVPQGPQAGPVTLPDGVADIYDPRGTAASYQWTDWQKDFGDISPKEQWTRNPNWGDHIVWNRKYGYQDYNKVGNLYKSGKDASSLTPQFAPAWNQIDEFKGRKVSTHAEKQGTPATTPATTGTAADGPGGQNAWQQFLQWFQGMQNPGQGGPTAEGPGGTNPYAQGTQGMQNPGINGPGGINPALTGQYSQGTQGGSTQPRNGQGGINPASGQLDSTGYGNYGGGYGNYGNMMGFGGVPQPGAWGTAGDVFSQFAYGNPGSVPWQWDAASGGFSDMAQTGNPTSQDPWYQKAKGVAQTDIQNAIAQASEQAGMSGLRYGSPLAEQSQRISGDIMGKLGSDWLGRELETQEAARNRQLQALSGLYGVGGGVSGLGESARDRALSASQGLMGLGNMQSQYPMQLSQLASQMGMSMQQMQQMQIQSQMQEAFRQMSESSPWLQSAMGGAGMPGQTGYQQYQQSPMSQFLGMLGSFLPFAFMGG